MEFSKTMDISDYRSVVAELLNKLRVTPTDAEEYVAHYTTTATVQAMLSEKATNRMWQFASDYMNDPEEGRYLVDLMIDAAKKSRHQHNGAFVERLTKLRSTRLLFSAYRNATFISCWTLVKVSQSEKESCDSLNHWRFYGDDGRGASIMLPVRHISEYFPEQLFHVVYGTEGRGGGAGAADRPANRLRQALTIRFDTFRQTLGNALEDLDEVIRETHPLLFLFKSPEYRAEREIRSLVHLPDYSANNGVTFFRPANADVGKAYIEGRPGLIGNQSIIFFGPKADHRLAIEAMGKASNLGLNIETFVSTKPYR